MLGVNREWVPEVEAALQNFIKTYPQPYPQGESCLWKTIGQGKPRPPVVESGRRGQGTPQQKIFAKVKLQYGSDQHL